VNGDGCDDCGAMASGKVVDLGRYRRGLELLSLASEAGARGVPVEALGLEQGFGGGDVTTETKEGGGPRGLTVRLSAEQVETLARLGPILTEQRPDLAALNGGVLSPYAVLRIAVGYGLRALEAETTRWAAEAGARESARSTAERWRESLEEVSVAGASEAFKRAHAEALQAAKRLGDAAREGGSKMEVATDKLTNAINGFAKELWNANIGGHLAPGRGAAAGVGKRSAPAKRRRIDDLKF
jgi:hypothetical protein